MSKTFTYTRQCGPSYYSEQTDEDFCDEESFDYEVESDELEEALAEIIVEEELTDTLHLDTHQKQLLSNNVAKFISNADLFDTLTDYYEDSLKEHFESKAMEAWNN